MKSVAVALIALALALLSACAPLSGEAAQELPFETVERSDYAAYTGEFWDVEAPGIAIVTAPSDIEQLNDFITPDSQEKLRSLDYDNFFALVAFLDVQGCSQREWGIEQVRLQENELVIYAIYPQPDYEKGQVCALGVYTPYHIIQLSREGVWEEAKHYTLYLNDEHAVTGSYPPVVSQATPAPTATQESIPAQTPWPTETPSPP
jgi:hypothetical protein